MGLDGVVLGTADLVAIGCVRDRNCESGCRSGISTIEPRMQLLRDVEINAQQIINFRAILQAQMIKALAALGFEGRPGTPGLLRPHCLAPPGGEGAEAPQQPA